MVRLPGDFLVGGYHLVTNILYLNEPATNGTVNQGAGATPAEGIGVENLVSFYQLSFLLKAIDDVLVTILYEATLVLRYLVGKLTLVVDGANGRNTSSLEYLVVVFTKARGSVNDTSSVLCGNKVTVQDTEGTNGRRIAVRTVGGLLKLGKIGEQWLIAGANQLTSLLLPQNSTFLRLLVIGSQAAFCQDVALVTVGHLYVIDVGSHGKTQVGGQGPGSGGPGQKISGAIGHITVIAVGTSFCYLEADSNGRVVNFLVAPQSQLVVGKNGGTAGTIWQDVVAFIQKSLFPQALENPPNRFHVLWVHGFIVVFKVYPAAQASNGLLPLIYIAENAGTTSLVELGYTVGFNVGLGIEAQFLFDKVFYRKTVAVPAKTTLHTKTFHGLVAGNNILDGAGNKVAKMRHSCCKGRTVIEDVLLAILTLGNGLLENIFFLPE